MDEDKLGPQLPDASAPSPRRSTCARVATWLALLILIAIAAAIGGKPLLSKAPTLTSEQGQPTLLFPGFGPVPVVLGPGCSDLALSEDWDSLHRASLTWLAEGKPCGVRVRRISGPRGIWGAEVGQHWPELDEQVVLLPNGGVLPVSAGADPLLEIERWEGSPGGGKRYLVWVYRPHGKSSNRVASFDDGHALGRLTEFGQSAGDGWEIHEGSEVGSRRLTVAAGKEFATYQLVLGGKTEEVVLERTYHGTWSPGDEAPE